MAAICIAGKNRIAIETVRIARLAGFDEIIAIANRSDDGEDAWQPSFRRYLARHPDVRLAELDDVYPIGDLLFLSVEFDRLLRPSRFATDRLYNIHFSLLPAYKGMYTSCHPILNGERESGCTLHRIDAGIDTGEIVAQASFPIADEDTCKQLYAKYIACGIDLLARELPRLKRGSVESVAQPVSGSTYYSKESIDYRSIAIDLKQTAFCLQRQLNAFNHRSYQLPRVLGRPIASARPLERRSTEKPGTVLADDARSITVATIDHDCVLWIDAFDDLIAAARADDAATIERIVGDVPSLLEESTREGWTPLIVAAYAAAEASVRTLLRLGAHVHHANGKGTTPLMYAKNGYLRTGDPAVLHLLLAAGADAKARDIHDLALLDYVDEARRPEIEAVLAAAASGDRRGLGSAD